MREEYENKIQEIEAAAETLRKEKNEIEIKYKVNNEELVKQRFERDENESNLKNEIEEM